MDCYNNCFFIEFLFFYLFRWLLEESEYLRDNYFKVLVYSDFIFNFVGMNFECYRIYEVLLYGFILVIEDVFTLGNCGNSLGFFVSVLYRLLKFEKVFVIFIKDW